MRLAYEPPAAEGLPPAAKFVERQTAEYPVEFEKSTQERESRWGTELANWAGAPRDHTSSLLWTKLIQWPDSTYTAFFVMNHCGSDAASMFSLIDSFLNNLGNPDSVRPAREFIDVFTKFDPMAAVSTPDAFAMPTGFLPLCGSSEPLPTITDPNPPHMSAVWSELDTETTTALVKNCRAHGSTIQAALSVASTIAVVSLQQHKVQLPQLILNAIPINMRQHLAPPIDKNEMACASSAIWWPQNISSDEKVWDAVKEARSSIVKQVENKSGLKFWAVVNLGILKDLGTHFTVMATSIGTTDLKEQYGSVKLLHVKFLGSSYHIPGFPTKTSGQHMTHVHTTLGKLQTTNSYETRAYTCDWAKKFTHNQQEVLKFLAKSNDDREPMTVSQLIGSLEGGQEQGTLKA